MSWPLIKLSDVVQVNPRCPRDIDEFQNVSFVAMASASEEGFLLTEETRVLGETKKGFTYFEKEDVLLAKITPCFENGKSLRPNQITHAVGFGSTEFHVLRADQSKVDSTYLFYMISGKPFRFLGERSMAGAAGQKRVGADFIKNFEIPLPPLDEQKRIAAILDKADAIRRKRQQAIQLADDFLRSVFLDMFGDPVTNPKGWEVRKVGDTMECIVPGRDKPKSFSGTTPWITTNDLNHLGVTSQSCHGTGLTENEIEDVRARQIPKNAIIMTCVGDLGVVSKVGTKIVMNQQLHAFIPNSNMSPEYVMYALSFQKSYMLKMASSTTVPYMNKTVCNSIPIPVPPIEVQREFSEVYTKAYKFLDHTEERIAPYVKLFDSLSQRAFSGQL